MASLFPASAQTPDFTDAQSLRALQLLDGQPCAAPIHYSHLVQTVAQATPPASPSPGPTITPVPVGPGPIYATPFPRGTPPVTPLPVPTPTPVSTASAGPVFLTRPSAT